MACTPKYITASTPRVRKAPKAKAPLALGGEGVKLALRWEDREFRLWRMRTRAFAEWRKRHADSVGGIGKKEETHLHGVSLLFW